MNDRFENGRRNRVLIDATSITERPDGLSTYIVQLIRHLPAAAPDLDFTALINPGVDRQDLNEALAYTGMKALTRRVPAIGLKRDWAILRLLPRLRREFVLIHITAMTYPLALRGGVCTIHDLTYRKWFHGSPIWRIGVRTYLNTAIRHCMRYADAVIAVSADTKHDLADLTGVSFADLTKVTIIHEGWEHMAASATDAPLPAVVPPGDYLFFLGSNRAHKNVSNLLEAFLRALPDIPPCKKLVITGSSNGLDGRQRSQVARLNATGERVVFTGLVSDDAVGALYRRADAFVFPSLKEGFGLPILEAFYHRAPLLAARAPAIPEVAGDAALYFDPFDVSAMAAAFVRFYAEPGLAGTLRERGTERLQQFSWTKAATETVSVYRHVLAGKTA